jgi:hypothetical protein
MEKNRIKRFNENSELNISDVSDSEKIKCPKHDGSKLLCSTCKNYCTITGEKIPELKNRF